MIKKKYVPLYIVFGIVLLILIQYHVLIPYIKNKKLLANCSEIYANKIIKLPDKEENNIGFTCTGLFWDEKTNKFLIGNAGKYKPNDEKFQASIEIVEKDFSSITNSIPCYLNFKDMLDIQGIAKTSDGTIWLSSYGENKVRQIDMYGNDIKSFYVDKPSGIANDSSDNTLWILTKTNLYNYTYDGKMIKRIKVNIKGQDQLFLDEKKNIMYISAGIDYYGDSYIYTVNLKTNEVKPLYILKDSYAIEGITIIDDVLYVLNDGYYHDAKVPVNQVNLYYLNNLQKDEISTNK